MTTRRNFIKTTGIAFAGLQLNNSIPGFSANLENQFISKRPEISKRRFISKAVEDTILEVKNMTADKELAWIFENCFPNTLDTTVTFYEKNNEPFTYVITGDIDAMWLRDSTAQVWPYLPLMKKDQKLKDLVKGLVNQQTVYVHKDPYANAFYLDENKRGEWAEDLTEMKPGVHERKWEIDSLCYVVRLAHGYWKQTDDKSIFNSRWQEAMKQIVKTFKEQQRKENPGSYEFQRITAVPTDTQYGRGFGNPTRKVGLIHSMFRPSDDSTFYPFLVSSNMFAVVSLNQLNEIFSLLGNFSFAAECMALANEVDQAIKEYCISEHLNFGKIYPLEVDGYGNKLFMDDANVPNLLSQPYLGYCKIDEPIYKNTRKFSLSLNNPWFNEGKYAKGIGGPHVGHNKIWPMGLIMQALTTNDEKEIEYCLKTLKATHAGTGFIHESFDVNNPNDFSRSWFAWANTLFGELILHLYHEKPEMLKKEY